MINLGKLKPIAKILFVGLLIFAMGLVDVTSLICSNNFLYIFARNLRLFTRSLIELSPIILLIAIFVVWKKISGKWTIKVEKMDIAGVSFIFEKPEELFKNQLKDYMNTKRALFLFDESRDNVADVIASYHETYRFICDKMSIYATRTSTTSKY